MNGYKNILDRYKHKSEIMRQAHSDLSSKYKFYHELIILISIIGSAFVTFFALADVAKILTAFGFNSDPTRTPAISSFLIALAGFLIFILSLLDFIKNWQDKYLKHELGIKLFTDLITNIKDVEKLMPDDQPNEELIESHIKEIREKYLLICEVLPVIPDDDFIESKKNYLKKRKLVNNLEQSQ